MMIISPLITIVTLAIGFWIGAYYMWNKSKNLKTQIKEVCFHTGTDGMKKHNEFIDWVNESGAEIINSYITYHQYDNSHKPQYINYVFKFKK